MGEILLQADPEPINIDVLKTAVIVVDMQNAFFSKGGYFDLVGYDLSGAQKIIGPCKEIIHLAREKQTRMIYLQMGFSADLSDSGGPNSPTWYKSRALVFSRERPELRDRLQVYGTWGAEIIDEMTPEPGDIIIRKQKHNGFIGTNLEITLKTLDMKYLVFIGAATNICVESTIRHACWLGYFSILVSDAVSHTGPSLTQEATIFNVKSTFGWVTTTENLLSALRSAPVGITAKKA